MRLFFAAALAVPILASAATSCPPQKTRCQVTINGWMEAGGICDVSTGIEGAAGNAVSHIVTTPQQGRGFTIRETRTGYTVDGKPAQRVDAPHHTLRLRAMGGRAEFLLVLPEHLDC